MRPPVPAAIIRRAAACRPWKVPQRFTVDHAVQVARAGVSSTGASTDTPALFTHTSRPPSSSVGGIERGRGASSASATSPATATARRAGASISSASGLGFAVGVARDGSRRTTSKPSAAEARTAMAAPESSRRAPVTTATRRRSLSACHQPAERGEVAAVGVEEPLGVPLHAEHAVGLDRFDHPVVAPRGRRSAGTGIGAPPGGGSS